MYVYPYSQFYLYIYIAFFLAGLTLAVLWCSQAPELVCFPWLFVGVQQASVFVLFFCFLCLPAGL